MIIKYNPPCASIPVGIPFTWGAQGYWCIKSTDGSLVVLSSGEVCYHMELEILADANLRYAKSMELK